MIADRINKGRLADPWQWRVPDDRDARCCSPSSSKIPVLCAASWPPDRGAPRALLSCHRSVGVLHLAKRARSFDRLRSDKKQTEHPDSRFRTSSLQSIRRILGDRACVTCRRSSETKRRSCGGRARCLQIERRTATSRRLSIGRGSVRCWG